MPPLSPLDPRKSIPLVHNFTMILAIMLRRLKTPMAIASSSSIRAGSTSRHQPGVGGRRGEDEEGRPPRQSIIVRDFCAPRFWLCLL